MSDTHNRNAQPSTDDTVISVDAMGGDAGVSAVITGMAIAAKDNPEVRFVVHGDEAEICKCLKRKSDLAARTEVVPTTGVVNMDDKPSWVLRNGKQTSMWATIEAVRNGKAGAAVSCGNTGALMMISMVRLRKTPGVDRPAIAILWPSQNPSGHNIMLDAGADIRATPQDLLKYAIMGASYARNGLNLPHPRVGLLNVGTEEFKGRSELHEASALISAAADDSDFDFVGYVEGSDLASSRVDIIVTDGFTGNIALKTGEGTAKLVRNLAEEVFTRNIGARIAAMMAVRSLKKLSRKIDPRRVNGGVFLGLNGTVVKSHGGADAVGVAAAIRLAIRLVQHDFAEKLASRVASGLQASKDALSTKDEASE